MPLIFLKFLENILICFSNYLVYIMTLQEYLDTKYTKEEQNDLTWLDCSRNAITSLEGIENLTLLTRLYCSNNALTSLKGIENLTNLLYLDCRNNNIKEIDLSNKELQYLRIDKSTKLLNIKKNKINQLFIS